MADESAFAIEERRRATMTPAVIVRLLCLWFAAAALLAGCGGTPFLTRGATPPDPPPIPRAKPEGLSRTLTPGLASDQTADARARRTGPSEHTVVAGETVYRISRAYGVPIRGLIDANSLVPPYRLRPGQRLAVPALRLHVVSQGDTVYGLSRRYGVEMSQLVRRNDIQPPFQIKLGETLILPDPVLPGEQAYAAAVPSAESSVQRREPGLRQVPQQAPQQARIEPRRTVDGVVVPSRKPYSGPAAPRAAPRPPARAVDPPPAQLRGPIPAPPPRASSRFLWPVDGRVALGYGPKAGGLHNDGINITAPLGAPIVAAENGVVAYAGNELRGFGNLLLIKHADGWVTAYAHAQSLLVGRGATVRRGQTIARVGSSGNVATPQLHFEIRKGADSVNPMKHLVRRAAAATE